MLLTFHFFLKVSDKISRAVGVFFERMNKLNERTYECTDVGQFVNEMKSAGCVEIFEVYKIRLFNSFTN